MSKKSQENILGGLGHSAATSLPCLASLGHLTADKREIKDFPKLPSATSFIRKTLGDILLGGYTYICKRRCMEYE